MDCFELLQRILDHDAGVGSHKIVVEGEVIIEG